MEESVVVRPPLSRRETFLSILQKYPKLSKLYVVTDPKEGFEERNIINTSFAQLGIFRKHAVTPPESPTEDSSRRFVPAEWDSVYSPRFRGRFSRYRRKALFKTSQALKFATHDPAWLESSSSISCHEGPPQPEKASDWPIRNSLEYSRPLTPPEDWGYVSAGQSKLYNYSFCCDSRLLLPPAEIVGGGNPDVGRAYCDRRRWSSSDDDETPRPRLTSNSLYLHDLDNGSEELSVVEAYGRSSYASSVTTFHDVDVCEAVTVSLDPFTMMQHTESAPSRIENIFLSQLDHENDISEPSSAPAEMSEIDGTTLIGEAELLTPTKAKVVYITKSPPSPAILSSKSFPPSFNSRRKSLPAIMSFFGVKKANDVETAKDGENIASASRPKTSDGNRLKGFWSNLTLPLPAMAPSKAEREAAEVAEQKNSPYYRYLTKPTVTSYECLEALCVHLKAHIPNGKITTVDENLQRALRSARAILSHTPRVRHRGFNLTDENLIYQQGTSEVVTLEHVLSGKSLWQDRLFVPNSMKVLEEYLPESARAQVPWIQALCTVLYVLCTLTSAADFDVGSSKIWSKKRGDPHGENVVEEGSGEALKREPPLLIASNGWTRILNVELLKCLKQIYQTNNKEVLRSLMVGAVNITRGGDGFDLEK